MLRPTRKSHQVIELEDTSNSFMADLLCQISAMFHFHVSAKAFFSFLLQGPRKTTLPSRQRSRDLEDHPLTL